MTYFTRSGFLKFDNGSEVDWRRLKICRLQTPLMRRQRLQFFAVTRDQRKLDGLISLTETPYHRHRHRAPKFENLDFLRRLRCQMQGSISMDKEYYLSMFIAAVAHGNSAH